MTHNTSEEYRQEARRILEDQERASLRVRLAASLFIVSFLGILLWLFGLVGSWVIPFSAILSNILQATSLLVAYRDLHRLAEEANIAGVVIFSRLGTGDGIDPHRINARNVLKVKMLSLCSLIVPWFNMLYIYILLF